MSDSAPEQPNAPEPHPGQTEVPLPAGQDPPAEPRPTQASEEGIDDESDVPDAGPARGPAEAPYVRRTVDATPNAATERDEEKVLRGLYGDPDEAGFYTGDGPPEEGASETQEDGAEPQEDEPSQEAAAKEPPETGNDEGG